MEDRLPALVRPRGDIAWPCSPFPVCPSALQLCTHFRPFDTYPSAANKHKSTNSSSNNSSSRSSKDKHKDNDIDNNDNSSIEYQHQHQHQQVRWLHEPPDHLTDRPPDRPTDRPND